jgi:hypothetical protein
MTTADSFIQIEFKIKKKSVRSWITTPEGDEPIFEEVNSDNTLLKALLKAHLWQRKIQRGSFENLSELCKYYKINDSYASKIMNLNYLSPKLLKLQDLMYDSSVLWR